MTRSDGRAIREAWEKAGYRVIKGKRHLKVVNQAGKYITSLSVTPSDPRSLANVRADIRRQERKTRQERKKQR